MLDIIRKRLDEHPQFRIIIGNTGWQMVDKIMRMAVGLAISIWIARYLGPDKLGTLSYAMAFVALFAPLATLGLEDIIVRDIARDPSCAAETMGSSFILRLAGGIASLVIAISTILYLRPSDSLVHGLVAILAFGNLFLVTGVIESWFISQVRAKYTVYAKSPAFFIGSIIRIILIIRKAPLIAFAWAGTIEMGLCSLGLVISYVAKGHRLGEWTASMRRGGRLIRDSWPLALSIIAMSVYQRIDQIMLGDILGNKEVGIYSVAVRMAEPWNFIATAIYWSVYPSIVKARTISDSYFFAQLQKYYNLMAFLGYAVAIPVSLSAHWLIINLFGAAYTKAGIMAIVLTWANIFTFMELARSAFLATMNWTKIYFVTVMMGAIINVALNAVLIPRYGGLGASFASLIAYWFAVHGVCFLFKQLSRTGIMMTKAMLYPKFW